MNGSTGDLLNTPTVQCGVAQCGVAWRMWAWAESSVFHRLIAWHWCLIQLQASVNRDVGFFFLLISEAIILQPVVAALILLALKLLQGGSFFLKALEMYDFECACQRKW